MKRKQAANTNTEIKEYLMSLIGNAPYGILAIDLQGIVTIANSLAVEYLGLQNTVTEVIDCPVISLLADVPECKVVLGEMVDGGRKPFDLERIPCRDRYLNIRGRKILNGLLITIEDITSRVKAEQALVKQKEELTRSNKELEEFAYISSHDMKSPVASLDGMLALMDQRGAVKKEFADLFEMARNSSGQMRKTINALNEIIAFRKTLNIQGEKLSFKQVLDEVKLGIHEQIVSSKAVIRADFSKCNYVQFPAIHLRSILQNLLTNAIKYKKEGKPPVIQITTSTEGNFVVLEVSDQGLGIDLNRYKGKLYGLFQRFHTHTEGMGIGLHVIQSIASSYGGRVMIDSKVNRGTTFKIYLGYAKVQ